MRANAKPLSVYLFLSLSLCACARQNVQPVRLPPLDAPQDSVAFGEPGGYRIQPGDLLRIKFLYHPELDVKVPVRPDGILTMQVAGQMQAAGLTTTQLEELIKERTSDRLREPEVSVIVAQVVERKVYVGGEVRVPGFVPFNQGMTPLQAIMDRGGFTPTARVDSVLKLSGSNEYQGTRLDLTAALQRGTPENVQLHAGDVLFVPRTFVGDVNTFVNLYIRENLPISPRVGFGSTF